MKVTEKEREILEYIKLNQPVTVRTFYEEFDWHNLFPLYSLFEKKLLRNIRDTRGHLKGVSLSKLGRETIKGNEGKE